MMHGAYNVKSISTSISLLVVNTLFICLFFKGKVVRIHATRENEDSRGKIPRIRNLVAQTALSAGGTTVRIE